MRRIRAVIAVVALGAWGTFAQLVARLQGGASQRAELVAEAVIALRLESTVEELMRTVHAHPTFAEAIGEAAHAAHGAAIHL